MNKKIMSLALLFLGLASCNNEEIIIKGNPEVLPDGYSGVTISLATTKDAGTRAVGDTLSVLTDNEKKIESIAFFVENVDGFKSYFSDEVLQSEKGLDEKLSKITEIEYKASIRVQGTLFGASEVVLIANYEQNGLTTDLKALTSMADLKAKTLTITDNATTPLLMYSAKNVTLKNGERLKESFDMTRMVGRIDIDNQAKGATAADGFELKSARLVNAKTSAFLYDKALAASIKALPVDPNKTFSERVTRTGDDTKIDTLYTYENPNDEPARATAVELIGTFKNAPVVKLVKFEKFNTVTKTYDPIAIQRNYRYVVEITPAKDAHDVELTIKVKDWDAADTIKIEATKNKPVINDFALVSGGAATITSWQGKAVRGINIAEGAVGTDQVLTFTTTEQQECAVEVAAVQGNNTTNPVSATLKVDKILSYADAAVDPTGKVKTTFTVTIPAYNTSNPDNNVGLRSFLLKVVNPIDKTKYDSIFVVQRIPYIDANAPAACIVKNIVWAPMNCGATEYDVTNAVATTGDITTKHGKLYQWGRKHGFSAHKEATFDFATEWPLNDNRPGMEEDVKWKGLFIKSNSSSPNTQGNWLLINGVGVDNPATMEVDAWYQKLWNANEVAAADGTVISNPKKTEYDPCPVGWRVATRYEWETINKGATHAWDTNKHYLTIAADAGEKPLVLPAAGSRNSSSGASTNQGSDGYYWSSSASASSVDASRVYFSSATLSQGTNGRAYGFSVRCVQE